MAALGAQSIASSYEQLLHVDADGGGNLTTHVSVKDGDNGTTFALTLATDAVMITSTNRLEFGDTGTYIHQSADGVLDLVSDTEIELNGTIDINGAVTMDGGNVTINDDSGDYDFRIESSTKAYTFVVDGGEDKVAIGDDDAAVLEDGVLTVTRSGECVLVVRRNGSNGELVKFMDGGTDCGSIDQDGAGTAYNTSSDYRLKENEVAISDGLSRLNQLKPYRFNFKDYPDVTRDGFFAHEVQSVVPYAVIGEKDAVDKDGNMDRQMIDQSKIVPLLVAAVQELSAKVEALEG
jgi:hypothetical protein